MIARGSMVVLKGHHLFPMVVVDTVIVMPVSNYRSGMADNSAKVTWLSAQGAPHEAIYPLEILEEVDG